MAARAPDRQSRRIFLARAAALGTAAFLRPHVAAAAQKARFESDPFTLGIASGSPREESVVLWTRLAPRPLEGGGLEPVPIEVRWEVARDDAFRSIVARGTALASPDAAHAVHAEVDGLEPAREYFYRFTCADAVSPVGRTRTTPRAGQGDERLRFAFGSCQQYEQGYYVAHRHLVADAPDLVIFLGDYIYESSWGRDHVRKHGAGAPFTLADYRNRYALYKTDADLQRAHAAAPWIVTWDDHEVENDYANDRGETLDPQFLARRSAAYRAFLEHMPLRRSVLLKDGAIRIYDRFAWGSLAAFHVLDDRQYRSWQVCTKPGRGGSNVVGDECPQRLDPALTLLGHEQESWLDDGFAQSRATWNVVTQQTLFSPAGSKSDHGIVHWTDGWDGYPAARERMLQSIARQRPQNPVIIGGDVHAQYFANVRAPIANGRAPLLATELCGTSITSQGPGPKLIDAILAENADIRWANGALRGYTLVELTRGGMEAKLRAVETIKRADSSVRTAATYHAVAGIPGLVE